MRLQAKVNLLGWMIVSGSQLFLEVRSVSGYLEKLNLLTVGSGKGFISRWSDPDPVEIRADPKPCTYNASISHVSRKNISFFFLCAIKIKVGFYISQEGLILVFRDEFNYVTIREKRRNKSGKMLSPKLKCQIFFFFFVARPLRPY